MGKLNPLSFKRMDAAVFDRKDWQKFMNYQRKGKKSENYLDVLLKIFQPFIEPEAVPVFAFEQ
jgi:hypothetical protein